MAAPIYTSTAAPVWPAVVDAYNERQQCARTLLAVMDACTPERLGLLERKAWGYGFAAELRTALGLDSPEHAE